MKKRGWKWQKTVILMIFTILAIGFWGTMVHPQLPNSNKLPPAKIHPLPLSLDNWQDSQNSGDYFQQIDSTPLGYLVWSRFPITVYIQQPIAINESASSQRFQSWVKTTRKAIAEWNVYLPLQEISEPETADISIWRSQPEREIKLNRDTGLYDIPRAVTAETNYRFYLQQHPTEIAHKMKIEISPNYTGISLLGTIRHELGHALGIWGHSPNQTDALYFSQTSNSPDISARDLNTLKKIYQQPTKLGWQLQ